MKKYQRPSDRPILKGAHYMTPRPQKIGRIQDASSRAKKLVYTDTEHCMISDFRGEDRCKGQGQFEREIHGIA